MKLFWWAFILAVSIQLVPFGHSHTPPITKETGWDSSRTASLFHRACYDYLPMHPNARLSDPEKQMLIAGAEKASGPQAGPDDHNR